MRKSAVIMIMPKDSAAADWLTEGADMTSITGDISMPTCSIAVEDASGYSAGDWVVLRIDCTREWIIEHHMDSTQVNDISKAWKPEGLKAMMYPRRVVSVDTSANVMTVDIPTRYPMKTRDNARVYKAGPWIFENGVENLAVGNYENPQKKINRYYEPGTGGYEVHYSHVIWSRFAANGWIRNVHTRKPETNTQDVHILSNGILLERTCRITVDSCILSKPQCEGQGGNGYNYTLKSADCLIKNSIAYHGRHHFTHKCPYTSGNVVTGCIDSLASKNSDFHMWFSAVNLYDRMSIDSNHIAAHKRHTGSHGVTTAQSVIWNTQGTSNGDGFLVKTSQFGHGYVIGTAGPSPDVSHKNSTGYLNPLDFVEGVGEAKTLEPQSLYSDQLLRRLGDIPEDEVLPPDTTTPPDSSQVVSVNPAYLHNGRPDQKNALISITGDMLRMSGVQPGRYEINVYNISGRQVYGSAFNVQNACAYKTVRIPACGGGLYVLSIQTPYQRNIIPISLLE